MVIVNQPPQAGPDAKEDNLKTLALLKKSKTQLGFRLHVIDRVHTPIQNGVGEARKIGMDYFAENIANDKNDRIVSLDADTTVAKNYFETLSTHSLSGAGFTLQFQHRTSQEETRRGIKLYEKYLRYIQQELEYAKSPFSFFTIGSCLGTDVWHYKKSGGMVAKNATEDFHFLNKLRKLGPIEHWTETCVYPSARMSNRVHLGTGHFLSQYGINPELAFQNLMLPRPKTFKKLRNILAQIEAFYDDPQPLKNAGELSHDVIRKLEEVRKNSTSKEGFQKRALHVFDGLQTWRLLRRLSKSETPVSEAEFSAYSCTTELRHAAYMV